MDPSSTPTSSDPTPGATASTNPDDHSPSSPPPDSHISPVSSLTYWRSTPPTVSGMLGGFPQVSATDLRGSYAFIRKLFPKNTFLPLQLQAQQQTRSLRGRRKEHRDTVGKSEKPVLLKRAVDCGAGIGRVTRGLLVRVAERVDVVEPVEEFAEVVRRLKHDNDGESSLREEDEANGDGGGGMRGGKVGEIFVCGLESWSPAPAPFPTKSTPTNPPSAGYDLIWAQWCLGHLRDTQLTTFLRLASLSLSPTTGHSYIVVKENISTDPDGRDMYDPVDSSVTRTEGKWMALFGEAGLRVERREVQGGFAEGLGLMPVVMWALRPE